MAWGAILGSLIGAGGQILGGKEAASGGLDPKKMVSANFDPSLDYATQAAQFDALNQLGFGDVSRIPDPWEQLAGRIQASPMNEKTRQSTLAALQAIRQDPTLLDDPYGAQFTRDEIFQANKTGAPFGRFVTHGSSGGGTLGLGTNPFIPGNSYFSKRIAGAFGVKEDREPTGLPIKGIGRLETALAASGMSLGDLKGLLKKKTEYDAQMKRLETAGLGRINEDTAIARAQAAANASQLIGDASTFGQTGEANGTVANILDRDNRQMKNLQDRIGLLTNFGGMSGAAGVKALTDADLDQNLRVLEQSLGMSNAISAALAPGQSAAAGSAAASSQNSLNAASIAAQQATAANQLRNATSLDNANSLGNAIGSASSAIGTGLANAAYLRQNQMPSSSSYFDVFGGPGSTANQNATSQVNYGGWNPNFNWGG